MASVEHDKNIIVTSLVFYEKFVAKLRTDIAQGLDVDTIHQNSKTMIMAALTLKALMDSNGDMNLIDSCMYELNRIMGTNS